MSRITERFLHKQIQCKPPNQALYTLHCNQNNIFQEYIHVAGAGRVGRLAAIEAEFEAAGADRLAVRLALHTDRIATVRHAGAPTRQVVVLDVAGQQLGLELGQQLYVIRYELLHLHHIAFSLLIYEYKVLGET